MSRRTVGVALGVGEDGRVVMYAGTNLGHTLSEAELTALRQLAGEAGADLRVLRAEEGFDGALREASARLPSYNHAEVRLSAAAAGDGVSLGEMATDVVGCTQCSMEVDMGAVRRLHPDVQFTAPRQPAALPAAPSAQPAAPSGG